MNQTEIRAKALELAIGYLAAIPEKAKVVAFECEKAERIPTAKRIFSPARTVAFAEEFLEFIGRTSP